MPVSILSTVSSSTTHGWRNKKNKRSLENYIRWCNWPWSGTPKEGPSEAFPDSAPAVPGSVEDLCVDGLCVEDLGASSSAIETSLATFEGRWPLMIGVLPLPSSTAFIMRCWSHWDMRRLTSIIISPAFDTDAWISSRVGWIACTQHASMFWLQFSQTVLRQTNTIWYCSTYWAWLGAFVTV